MVQSCGLGLPGETVSVHDDLKDLTHEIIGSAMAVHRALGPGLLESTYERCLAHELRSRRLRVDQQHAVHISYRDLFIEDAYYIDLLVERRVVVELKSVEELREVHIAQVLTQLRWANLDLGLLVNFNVSLLKNGVRRVIRANAA